MPRNKVEMKLIEDHKKRKVTFKNRSDGIIEKTKQITILTHCDALCICYDPTAPPGGAPAKIWPTDRREAQKLVRKYRGMPEDRFRQVLTPLTFNEEELSKEQGKLLKAHQCGPGKLGAWDSRLEDASVADMKALLLTLDEKLHSAQQRMAALGMIAPVSSSAAVVAAPVPLAMSLPENGFSLLPADTTGGPMVTHLAAGDHMMPQPYPLQQPPCHGYQIQMPQPYLSYQTMPPPPPPLYLGYQMPQEFGGYGANVVDGASAAPEFYDDLVQGFDDDAGGAYVSDDVLEQAFSAGPPTAGFRLAHHAAVGVWPLSRQGNNPMDDGAAFQLRNDFAWSASCSSSTTSSFNGGFQN